MNHSFREITIQAGQVRWEEQVAILKTFYNYSTILCFRKTLLCLFLMDSKSRETGVIKKALPGLPDTLIDFGDEGEIEMRKV